MASKLTHPDSDLELQVEADMVPMYESQGWEKSPNAQAPAATAK